MTNASRRFLLIVSLGFLTLVGASACISTLHIDRIQAEPGKYSERPVVVKGTVVKTFALPMMGQSFVKIDDGTGQIWVKPRNWVPFEGQEVKIKGTLRIGMTIANKNLGVVVYEEATGGS